ncbi:TPA: polysaccharide biosynthesis tyrosine autokinase [Serratia marcescens]|uniref:polysaccharide biosynthesis tyrosine autokinase n=1 Tax=Serratia TaxID=613 RepID=UPI000B617133|nr:polysaccharide biosynthesis tyrosine autokinase [Serratia marcescens]ASM30298.1 tyrosine-protein kinase [Serratia marcescens]QDI32440.1 polysaccharide biosynthesis tyrosine autokinase [Serratia marcescens]
MSEKIKVTHSGTEKSESIDMGRLVGELIDNRWLIVTVTSFLLSLGVLYSLFSTPIYRADAMLQVEQKQGNAILNSLSQILPDSQPQSAPEIALLQSRMILGKAVDELNLQASVEQDYFPVFGKGWSRLNGEKAGKLDISRLYLPANENAKDVPEIILTVLDNKRYKVENAAISLEGHVGELLDNNGVSLMVNAIDAAPGTKFTVKYKSKLEVINELLKVYSVADQGKDTGMLSLTLTGEDPVKIREILDSIANIYMAQNIARQAAQDAKSLDFLQEQMPKVRSDLDIAESKLNQYRQQKDSVDLNLEAQSVLNQIVNVDNQLNELTIREAEVSQLYTQSHPTYKALLEKRSTLEQEKKKLNKRVSAMPETQQEVLRLSRDVESGRAVYMQLLNRQQELSIAKSSAIGYVRIIDSAITAPKPVKPQKALIILISLVLGGVFSVGLILANMFLRRGIESPEQLEELGINVYASVPVSEWLIKESLDSKKKIKSISTVKNNRKDAVFLAVENPADLAVEAIRGLRTSLHFAMMEANNKILMISGASPNAGKTFVSSNLAAVIANTGKKVLFIDADMRKGYIHKNFGFENTDGLSGVLSGKIPVEQAIKNVASANFDFISRGQVPPNPAELLMHERLAALLTWADKNYDLIVIDTPPILAVTDAAIIGGYAGTTLLVARFEQNTAKEIEVSIKRFEQSGVVVKGCILNGMVKKASSYYGYGYNHYGYSYSDKK